MPVTKIKPLYTKKGKLIGYVDKYTGEEYGFPAVYYKKRNPYSKGWFMNNQETSILLAKDKDIKEVTHKVLRYIEGILDFENWIYISINEIAKELEIHRTGVSRSIKLLQEKQIILKGPKVGNSYSYMLNPNFAWKGKVKNLEKYREEKEKEKIEELKNKINKKRQKKLEELSKKFSMSFEELQEIQNELNLT